MKVRESIGDRLFMTLVYIVVFACAFICLYPLYLVLINSFSDPNAVANGETFLWIADFTIEGYKLAFEDNSIVRGYANSLYYLVVGTLLNLLLTIPAAYALSKKRLMGRRVFMTAMVITMYFSGGTVPTYLVIKDLGLLDTWAVVLLSAGINTSNLIIARTFFQNSVPQELEEAAQIDGASTMQIFMRIILPLSKAMIGVITLYYAVGRWNAYTSSLYYQPMNSDMWPLQMVLRRILLLTKQNAGMDPEMAEYYAQLANQMKYAVVVIASAPLLIIYPFIQKYFDKGIMMGSVKG
ncbi:MAG: carbohydrate ABC transporter permease [Ruminococcaceae bacterium]|nr:carbohydrate ABC transporter permease [Oscillospiraceae bacterium]